MPHRGLTWTDKQDALVLDQRAEGRTFAAIAGEFSDRSESSVRARYRLIKPSAGSASNPGPWSQEHKNKLLHLGNLRYEEGKKWEEIAAEFPGRTLAEVQAMYCDLANGGSHVSIITSDSWNSLRVETRQAGDEQEVAQQNVNQQYAAQQPVSQAMQDSQTSRAAFYDPVKDAAGENISTTP